MLRRSFLLLPFLLMPIPPQDPRGDAVVRERAQRLLARLTRFGCSVDVLGDAAPLVDRNRLQTRLELKLRQLGIPVSSGSIVPEPTLTLSAYTLPLSKESISLMLSVVLVEVVAVPRLDGLSHLGRTWGGNPMLTVTTPAKIADDIEGGFNELLEMFANDYLAANPRGR